MQRYARILQPETQKASDSPVCPTKSLRERHLHAIWAEQKWFLDLMTSQGDRIEVLAPGIWNTGPGPDFIKAELKINGTLLKGDIEIHLHDRGWEQHGHHHDPRYNDVILHISLYHDSSNRLIQSENGVIITQTYLERRLILPIDELIALIDLDLYPHKEYLGSGTCAKVLFSELEDVHIESFFHEAALWRAKKKYEHLNFFVTDSADLLVAGICQALGFKNNSTTFLRLFRELQSRKLPTESETLAFVMKATGFFSEKYRKLWGQDAFYQRLLELSPLSTSSYPLHYAQVRPLNHPLRRLVYLAKLMSDPTKDKIQRGLMALWERFDQYNKLSTFLKEMRTLIPDYHDSYFESRYFFGNLTSNKRLGLIGEETKNEILLNVFIPFLLCTMVKDRDQERLSKIMTMIPFRTTGKSKYLAHRFFGQSARNQLLARGDLQQGAYQLHKDFCQHYESSCNGCPFINRYKNVFIEK